MSVTKEECLEVVSLISKLQLEKLQMVVEAQKQADSILDNAGRLQDIPYESLERAVEWRTASDLSKLFADELGELLATILPTLIS